MIDQLSDYLNANFSILLKSVCEAQPRICRTPFIPFPEFPEASQSHPPEFPEVPEIGSPQAPQKSENETIIKISGVFNLPQACNQAAVGGITRISKTQLPGLFQFPEIPATACGNLLRN
ncbi:MAG: hypothetical protein IT343_24025 [Candidatus Melainabacteria bacterium]|nr:hypothetical protein [Candidatus Melainabacteria bacterium]